MIIEYCWIAFFLLLTAVFWGIPILRRSTGHIAGAGKTAMPGCLISVLLPVTFSFLSAKFGMQGFIWLELPILLGIPLAALFVIPRITSALHVKAGGDPKNAPRITALFLYFVLVPVYLVSVTVGNIILCFAGFNDKTQLWVNTPLDGVPGKIVFQQKSIHPFLAEYDYRVTVRLEDGKEITSYLPVNAGGKTKINVYETPRLPGIAPAGILFCERYIPSWLNTETGKTYEIIDNGRELEEITGSGLDKGYNENHVRIDTAKWQLLERRQYLGTILNWKWCPAKTNEPEPSIDFAFDFKLPPLKQ